MNQLRKKQNEEGYGLNVVEKRFNMPTVDSRVLFLWDL